MRRHRKRGRFLSVVLLALVGGALASCLEAAQCWSVSPHLVHWEPLPGSPESLSNNCFGGTGFRCYPARQPSDWYVRKEVPSCNPQAGACEIDLVVPLNFPGVDAMWIEDQGGGAYPRVFWFDDATSGTCFDTPFPPMCDPPEIALCGLDSGGGLVRYEFIETRIELGALSCDDLATSTEEYSINVRVCPSGCVNTKRIDNLIVSLLAC